MLSIRSAAALIAALRSGVALELKIDIQGLEVLGSVDWMAQGNGILGLREELGGDVVLDAEFGGLRPGRGGKGRSGAEIVEELRGDVLHAGG